MSIYKASIFNFIFNSANDIIVIINGIVMVPIYFHYMSVSTYGAWLATGNVVAMLGLIESGFSGVVTQKMTVAVAEGDDIAFRELAGANLVTAILLPLAVLLMGLAISPFIAEWVNVDSDDIGAIRLSFIVALISSCIAMADSLICTFSQVWQDTKAIGMIGVIVNIVTIVSLIVYLILGCGVVAIAWSYLTRALLNFFFQGYWILKKWLLLGLKKPLVNFATIKDLSKSCVYPFLSKISGVLMGHSQSFIIALFMNPALATVYDLTSKICTIACGFVSKVNGAFFALFSLTLASKDRKKIDAVFTTTTRFSVVMLSAVFLYAVCFTKPVMHYWVGLDKYGGTWLLLTILIANIISYVRSYSNTIIFTAGMIDRSARLDIMCMVVYLSILFLVLSRLQIYALPVAMIVSSGVFLIKYLQIVSKEVKIGVRKNVKFAVSSFAVTIPFLAVHYLLNVDYHHLLVYALYFLAFSAIFVMSVYMTNRELLQLILQKLRKRK